MHAYAVVFMTAANAEEAAKIARALVEAHLAACCNIVPAVRSIYRWQGEVCDEAEAMMVAKTRQDALPALIEKVRSLHSYTVPEIIAVPVVGGFDGYLEWIGETVQAPQ